ncbi:chorismate-binding protein [Spirochaetia bacterium 38H-sp]|uniref:Chorismate-binding protein n=1 Tax=Rarispira pelagica TaxID=3141764 RepID=A0ABU9UBI9_9SPIR
MKAVFYDYRTDNWIFLSSPLMCFYVYKTTEIEEILREVEDYVQKGYFAAGYVAYEAAKAFDSAMHCHNSYTEMPLAAFCIFSEIHRENLAKPEAGTGVFDVIYDIGRSQYLDAFKRIKDYIQQGDTYQINYTMRLSGKVLGSPYGLFCRIVSDMGRAVPPYCAFFDMKEMAVLSFSPELFFEKHGEVLVCKPMKGTQERSYDTKTDIGFAKKLYLSQKDRAENIMITDMIRNDMGRIADKGTVTVPALFSIQALPYAYQMISTVKCRTSASFYEILKAMFPCASITGAPKIRSMQIIAELENSPRGIYTGSMCLLTPDYIQCNVAIRTMSIIDNQFLYGTGGGIVWDSDPASEYGEALLKASFLEQYRLD